MNQTAIKYAIEIIPQKIAKFTNDDIMKIFPITPDIPATISVPKTPEIRDFVNVFEGIPITFVAYQGTKSPLLSVNTIAPTTATP